KASSRTSLLAMRVPRTSVTTVRSHPAAASATTSETEAARTRLEQGRCEITQEGTTRRCRATARGARVAAAREGADTGAATLWRRALGVRALGAALRGPVGLGPTAGDEPGLPAGRLCGTLLDLPLAVGGQLAVVRTRVGHPGRAAHEVTVARGACTVAVALD